MFRKYDKIHRLGKEEVDGILEGTVHVQEKIDGANTSIWLDEGKDLNCGSRNQVIKNNDFNGFVTFALNSPLYDLLLDCPDLILYGEWLVKHTVSYNPESYKQWYLIDIFDIQDERYLTIAEINRLRNSFEFNQPAYFGCFVNPTIDDLKPYVGQSNLGPVGEGIVIKNYNFKNRWGNHCHAKMVRQEFLEDNALLFNSNNKASDSYTEQYIVNKWLNEARVNKVAQKLQPEINKKLDLEHIPRITNSVYYDLISEEGWGIAKLNKQIDYKKLKTLAMKKAKLLYVTQLEKGYENAN